MTAGEPILTGRHWLAIAGHGAVITASTLAAIYLPGLSDILRLTAPDAAGWGLVLGASLTPLVVGQTAFALLPPGRTGPSAIRS